MEIELPDLRMLAGLCLNKQSLPAILFADGKNTTPEKYLEDLVETGSEVTPRDIAILIDPAATRSVRLSTAAAALLKRFRTDGRLPETLSKTAPKIAVRTEDEALALLARCYRVERPVPTHVEVDGAKWLTSAFLASLRLDRNVCPRAVAADIGLPTNSALICEAAISLLGRFQQQSRAPQ